MNLSLSEYKRHRFPSEIIQHVVWLYYRFNLSYLDVEDLLAERGIIVSYEGIRLWCNKFCLQYAQQLKRNAVYNLFNLGRHLVVAKNFRNLWGSAFACWKETVA